MNPLSKGLNSVTKIMCQYTWVAFALYTVSMKSMNKFEILPVFIRDKFQKNLLTDIQALSLVSCFPRITSSFHK